ncbi:MAG: hypothetical protein LBL35_04940 [Clostridiales bacterium]|jgi:hypothetical protein|nr:hypothetical protein [Clostridiales bacterium]
MRRNDYKINLMAAMAFAVAFILSETPVSAAQDERDAVISLNIKEEDGVLSVTENAFTIQWDAVWTEVYDPFENSWSKTVGFNGSLVYGETAAPATLDLRGVAMSDDEIKKRLIDMGADANDVQSLKSRVWDLTNALYDVYVAEYDYALNMSGGMAEYAESLGKDSGAAWREVNAFGPEYEVTRSDAPVAEDLRSNTVYAAFVRPYVMNDNEKISYGVGFLNATTLIERSSLDIKPAAPKLRVLNAGENAVTLGWKYIEGQRYELRYSDEQSDYPAGGQAANMENNVIRMIDGEMYVVCDVPGLYASTDYIFWIRAPETEWSSFAETITAKVAAPRPPRGFGVFAKTRDSVTFEWMKNGGDYGYRAEFDALTPYTVYYARAKTAASAKDADRIFGCVVQLSEDDNFLTYVETSSFSPDGEKVVYSDWTQVISVRTDADYENRAYDTDESDDNYPSPSSYFETTYDRRSRTLTWRLRGGSRGKFADQRFISRLIESEAFDCVAGDTGRGVFSFVAELPRSVLKTLDERKITLRIVTENAAAVISPECVTTAAEKAGYSDLRLTLKTNGEGRLDRAALSFFVEALKQGRETRILTFPKPITMECHLFDADGYFETYSTGSWMAADKISVTDTPVLNFDKNVTATEFDNIIAAAARGDDI